MLGPAFSTEPSSLAQAALEISRPQSAAAIGSGRRRSTLISSPLQRPIPLRAGTSQELASSDDDAAVVDNDALDESDTDEDDAEYAYSDEEEGDANRLDLVHGKKVPRKKRGKRFHSTKRKPTKGPAAAAAGDADSDEEQKETMTEIPRSGSVGHTVARGLQFASSQGRNRRRMEKYSPAPNRLTNASPALGSRANRSTDALSSSGSILRTNTRSPGPSAAARAGLLFSEMTPINPPAAERATSMASRTQSPEMIAMDLLRSASPDQLSDLDNLLSRVQTQGSLTSQGSVARRTATLRGLLKTPGRLFTLNRHKDADAMSIASQSKVDPEKELDDLLSKALAQEEPGDLGEKYEYDILYENQRG